MWKVYVSAIFQWLFETFTRYRAYIKIQFHQKRKTNRFPLSIILLTEIRVASWPFSTRTKIHRSSFRNISLCKTRPTQVKIQYVHFVLKPQGMKETLYITTLRVRPLFVYFFFIIFARTFNQSKLRRYVLLRRYEKHEKTHTIITQRCSFWCATAKNSFTRGTQI